MPPRFGRRRVCTKRVRWASRVALILVVAIWPVLSTVGVPFQVDRTWIPQFRDDLAPTTLAPMLEDGTFLASLAGAPSATALARCFDGVSVTRSAVGHVAAVVRFSRIAALSLTTGSTIGVAAASALRGLVDGGVGHIVLVPGGSAWPPRDVEDVSAGVHGLLDEHGVSLMPGFSALSPEHTRCVGGGDAAAGVAWAIASGADAVLMLDHVSPLQHRALFFDPGLPRFLPQVGRGPDDDEGNSTAHRRAAETLSPSASVSHRLQSHFVACGGRPAPCAPMGRLCSRWLRPAVQYGLCHSEGHFVSGRHDTIAANSPADASHFSGGLLLEEVSTLSLWPSAVWPSRLSRSAVVDETEATAWPANRLAHRTAAWTLLDNVQHGRVAQAVVEILLWETMQGNITVLPPGRLCNTTGARSRYAVGGNVAPDVSMHTAVHNALAAWRTEVSAPSHSTFGVPAGRFASLVGDAVLTLASRPVVPTGAPLLSQDASMRLRHWFNTFAAAVSLSDSGWKPPVEPTHIQRHEHTPPDLQSLEDFAVAPLLSSHGDAADSILGQMLRDGHLPWKLTPLSRPAPNGTDAALAAEPAFEHCYSDHHSVRDIILVINFNSFEARWGVASLRTLLRLYAPFFPAIVATHATHAADNSSYALVGSDDFGSIGIPALHLERCNQNSRRCWGCNGWQSQHCAARALTRYSGHLGFIVAQDDALLSPWNWLANSAGKLWHKRKWPANTPPFSTRDWVYSCNEPPWLERSAYTFSRG